MKSEVPNADKTLPLAERIARRGRGLLRVLALRALHTGVFGVAGETVLGVYLETQLLRD